MKFVMAVMLLVFIAGCTGTQNIYQTGPTKQIPQTPIKETLPLATPIVTQQPTPQQTASGVITLTIKASPSVPVGTRIPINVEASYVKNLESIELQGEGVANNLYACSAASCRNTWVVTLENPGTYEYKVTARAVDKESAIKTAKIVAR